MTDLLLAVDPGDTQSGWCVIDTTTRRPREFGKDPNGKVIAHVEDAGCMNMPAVIELVASYGMPVGKEVFETCIWTGRFIERYSATNIGDMVGIYRRDIKLHHCGQARAKDTNIRQALVDRFAPGAPNHGKGTKTHPGWFHGFRSDIWAAYALAVYAADKATGYQP